MKPSSAKAKGRKFQQYVRDKLLDMFPELGEDDVTSRSMGAGGEDILLSRAARQLIPNSFECKHRKTFAIYKDYEQAASNAKGHEPVICIKANGKKPLAVVDLDYLIKLIGR